MEHYGRQCQTGDQLHQLYETLATQEHDPKHCKLLAERVGQYAFAHACYAGSGQQEDADNSLTKCFVSVLQLALMRGVSVHSLVIAARVLLNKVNT